MTFRICVDETHKRRDEEPRPFHGRPGGRASSCLRRFIGLFWLLPHFPCYPRMAISELLQSSVFLSSLLFFSVFYGFGYLVLFKKFRGLSRFEAASCGNSFIHGIGAIILCSYDLLTSPWKLDAPNTVLENRIMEFSIAYFVIDFLHYILVNPSDYLFILHHIATTLYMGVCRCFTGHGGLSAISLMCTGEATSPLQNVWTISRLAKGWSPLANRVYSGMSAVFTLYFTIMRCVVGPYLAWVICSFYIPGKADGVIPRGVAYFWVVTVILAIVGSFVWVYKLWVGLIRFYSKGKNAAKKT